VTLDRRAPPDLERPIESLDDLIGYFRSGEKPRERWRVGIEHEKLALRDPDATPVPYEGEGGIEALLRALAERPGWQPILEDGRVIGVDGSDGSVSLEPGAQVELNGTPLETIHEICAQFHRHLAFLRGLSDPLDITWLGLGAHPLHPTKDLPQVPRERYRIMRRYLPGRGSLGLDMMHATAAVQVSFDYADEADLVTKLRMALGVTPIAAALFANSSIAEGRPSGFVSRRLHIWRHTDPDRTGLLPFALDPDFGYARYAEWALDVPMFFIVRDGRYHPMQGRSFRQFLAEGLEGERATLADFDRHLTTLFPEVRVKRILEVRSADAVPPDLLCAVPALWKGLLYDPGALEAAARLAAGWTPAAREAALEEVARRGLAAETATGPVLALARELVAIAREGLVRIAPSERDERRFLEPLEALLERGRSPGEEILERWNGEWGRSPSRLIEYARY
jgi:glutamate--cysteine ligase